MLYKLCTFFAVHFATIDANTSATPFSTLSLHECIGCVVAFGVVVAPGADQVYLVVDCLFCIKRFVLLTKVLILWPTAVFLCHGITANRSSVMGSYSI